MSNIARDEDNVNFKWISVYIPSMVDLEENLCLLSNFLHGYSNPIEGCFHSTTIRAEYNAKITAARLQFLQSLKQKLIEKTPEQWAKEAYDIRQQHKEEQQAKTVLIGKLGIYIRNWIKYGNSIGPDFKDLLKHKSIEEIINSSFRTDGSDLGLMGNVAEDLLYHGFFNERHEENSYVCTVLKMEAEFINYCEVEA